MKKFMLFILLFLPLLSFSQIKVKQISGKTLVQVRNKPIAKPTEFSFIDKDGKVYQVFATGKGGYYINKTSKKTGKVYRAYLSLQK